MKGIKNAFFFFKQNFLKEYLIFLRNIYYFQRIQGILPKIHLLH